MKKLYCSSTKPEARGSNDQEFSPDVPKRVDKKSTRLLAGPRLIVHLRWNVNWLVMRLNAFSILKSRYRIQNPITDDPVNSLTLPMPDDLSSL